MESPKSTKSGLNYYVMTTPKASKKLYWPKNSENGSPKMCGFAEKQEEFGWGDSPEPLKLDPKYITGHSKKRLDCLESPVSTHPKRRISKPRPVLERKPSPNTADTDLARIQEINRRILSSRTSDEIFKADDTFNSVTSITSKLNDVPPVAANPSVPIIKESLDTVLQSFFQEEDDVLLSQVNIAAEVRQTPNKTKFTKSLSDNQLNSPNRSSSNTFRRTSSFQNSDSAGKEEPQPLKKQKSFHVEIPRTQMKCSLEEIEKKRLEAKYRREIKEIERRKMEAQKRLNERRARMASDMVKR